MPTSTWDNHQACNVRLWRPCTTIQNANMVYTAAHNQFCSFFTQTLKSLPISMQKVHMGIISLLMSRNHHKVSEIAKGLHWMKQYLYLNFGACCSSSNSKIRHTFNGVHILATRCTKFYCLTLLYWGGGGTLCPPLQNIALNQGK